MMSLTVLTKASWCFSPRLQMFQLYLQVLRLFHLFIQRPLQLPALVMGLIELDAQNHIVPHTHVNYIENTFLFNTSFDRKFTQYYAGRLFSFFSKCLYRTTGGSWVCVVILNSCPHLVFGLAQLLLKFLHSQSQFLDFSFVALHPAVGVSQLRRPLLELLLHFRVNMAEIGQLLEGPKEF